MKHRLNSKAVVGVIGTVLALTASVVSAGMVYDPNNPSKVAPETCFTFKDDKSNGRGTRIYNDCRAESVLSFCVADPKSRIPCPRTAGGLWAREGAHINGNDSAWVADVGDESRVRYFGCELPYTPSMNGHMKGICGAVFDEDKKSGKPRTSDSTTEQQAPSRSKYTEEMVRNMPIDKNPAPITGECAVTLEDALHNNDMPYINVDRQTGEWKFRDNYSDEPGYIRHGKSYDHHLANVLLQTANSSDESCAKRLIKYTAIYHREAECRLIMNEIEEKYPIAADASRFDLVSLQLYEAFTYAAQTYPRCADKLSEYAGYARNNYETTHNEAESLRSSTAQYEAMENFVDGLGSVLGTIGAAAAGAATGYIQGQAIQYNGGVPTPVPGLNCYNAFSAEATTDTAVGCTTK